MDFIDDVRTRSRRFQARIEHLDTEEATKTALIMPFIQMLGYNIFDPTEVVPEFTADFGTKKGEKVDYALMQNGAPVVLIEAKKHGANLRVEQESQLFRYFSATTARFGILTDGIVYRFYSDLDEPREMDKRPFFEFNMLDFTDVQVEQLKQFHKDSFDPTDTVEAARELKYTNEIIRTLSEEMKNPTDDFVRFVLTRMEYPGSKTRQRIEQFTPVVQQAFTQFVKDLIDSRLKSALESGNEQREEATVKETTVEGTTDIEYPLYLFLDSQGVEARARCDDMNQFVVLAGSQAVKDERSSIPKRYADMRDALIKEGILVEEGSMYRLIQDQTFNSPSGAASFLLAASRGPRIWKNVEGRVLSDIVATS